MNTNYTLIQNTKQISKAETNQKVVGKGESKVKFILPKIQIPCFAEINAKKDDSIYLKSINNFSEEKSSHEENIDLDRENLEPHGQLEITK